MAAVARRIEADPFARRSHLRLVTTPPAPAPARKRASAPSTAKRTVSRRAASAPSAATRARIRQEEARARAIFGVFATVLLCAIALGGVRVTLIARAAQASITEGRVAADIKAQRAETDKLEVDRSALSTPSRIAGIAGSAMDMGEPHSVRYISMPDVASGAAGATAAESPAIAGAVAPTDIAGRLFGVVMDLSAGEAQSLLVGDLGLAGSR